MIALKVEKRDGKVSIVLNAEAEEALREVEVVY
ncbi:MAG: hypothetical protein JWM33_1197, partial [Caulobacteraceae bacterium]|nr:hypothetical protein [Caulobacteraceae bacterium]